MKRQQNSFELFCCLCQPSFSFTPQTWEAGQDAAKETCRTNVRSRFCTAAASAARPLQPHPSAPSLIQKRAHPSHYTCRFEILTCSAACGSSWPCRGGTANWIFFGLLGSIITEAEMELRRAEREGGAERGGRNALLPDGSIITNWQRSSRGSAAMSYTTVVFWMFWS